MIEDEASAAPLPSAAALASAVPSGFEAFRQLVISDASLLAQLRPIMDREALIRMTHELGAARGYRFDISEVEAAMSEGQFAWLTHWLPVV
jgi:hypothetical protein